MSIPETIILALIAAVASVAAALAGRGYTRRSKQLEAETARLAAERERESARLATEEVRWDRLEADVKRLAAEVAALRQENEQLRREHAAERAARGDAEDTVRDHEELIEDLLTYLIVLQDWESSGTEPPPTLPWRVRSALRKRRAAMTGPVPTAHDQTTTPPTSQED